MRNRFAHWVIILGLMACLGRAVATFAEQTPSASEPDRDIVSFVTANGFLHKGLYDLAIPDYRKFLTEHASHAKAATARYGLAVCLFRTQKFDEARTELDALRGDSGFEFAPEVLAMSGQCHAQAGRFDEAAASFAEIVSRFPTHDLFDDAATGWVEALYRGSQFKQADGECQRLASQMASSPVESRFTLYCAMTDLALDQCEAAAVALARLKSEKQMAASVDQALVSAAACFTRAGAFDRAAAIYAPILESSNHAMYADALLGVAIVDVQQAKWAKAAKSLDQFLDRFPDHPSKGVGLMLRGRAAYELGEISLAADAFEKAARAKDSDKTEANYWLAKCRLREKRFADAVEILRGLSGSMSNDALAPEIGFDLGAALAQSGQDEDAIAAWTALRARFGSHALAADALYMIAFSEHRLSRWERCRERVETFLGESSGHALAGDASYLKAECLFHLGQYAEAVAAYQNWLKGNSSSERARSVKGRLGWCLHRLERFDDAAEVLVTLVGDGPCDEICGTASWLLGDVSFRRGEWKTAATNFSRYLASATDTAMADDALFRRGLSLQRNGDAAAALTDFEQLLAKYPTSGHRLQATFERGQVLLSLGRGEEAGLAFREVVREDKESRFKSYAEKHLASLALQTGDYQGAIRLLSDKEGGGEGNAVERLQLAQALLASEKFAEAEQVLKGLVVANGDIGPRAAARALLVIAVARQERWESAVEIAGGIAADEAAALQPELRDSMNFEHARGLQAAGRLDDARVLFDQLLSGNPNGVHANHAKFQLARIALDQGKNEAAAKFLRDIKDAMRVEGAVPADLAESATYQLGVCEYELKNYAAAVEALRDFVGKFPQSKLMASAGYFAGDSLFKLNRFEPATVEFARIVESLSTDPVFGPALLRLGECHAARQKWGESEAAFAKYLERFSDSESWYQAQFGVGWALENQQKYDLAITNYEKVVARHSGPTTARAQFQIGECLFAKKEYESAIRELLKVDILYSYPEWSAAALYEAGRCFAAIAKQEDARKQFAAVVERFPTTAWAERASKELKGKIEEVPSTGTQ